MATKRSVRKRVAKALKKFIRGNPTPAGAPPRSSSGWDYYGVGGYSFSSPVGRYTIQPVSRGQRTVYQLHSPAGSRGLAYSEHATLAGAISRARANHKRAARSNPARVKGRKVKGGRSVTLKNFTGTVVRKSDGRVEIRGKGRR